MTKKQRVKNQLLTQIKQRRLIFNKNNRSHNKKICNKQSSKKLINLNKNANKFEEDSKLSMKEMKIYSTNEARQLKKSCNKVLILYI